MPGFAMQWTDREYLFDDQCIEERRFTRADAPEYGKVQMAMLDFVEHSLNGFVIVRQ